jgi:hypothetical protein
MKPDAEIFVMENNNDSTFKIRALQVFSLMALATLCTRQAGNVKNCVLQGLVRKTIR